MILGALMVSEAFKGFQGKSEGFSGALQDSRKISEGFKLLQGYLRRTSGDSRRISVGYRGFPETSGGFKGVSRSFTAIL